MLKVINLRGNTPLGPFGVYVGRYCTYRPELTPSPLANPFSGPNREKNIEDYDSWLVEQIRIGTPEVVNELNRLLQLMLNGYDIDLACWCVLPDGSLDCHARIIMEVLIKFYEQE